MRTENRALSVACVGQQQTGSLIRSRQWCDSTRRHSEGLGSGRPTRLESEQASTEALAGSTPPPSSRVGTSRLAAGARPESGSTFGCREFESRSYRLGEDADIRWPHTVANRAARKGVVGAAPTFSASRRNRFAIPPQRKRSSLRPRFAIPPQRKRSSLRPRFAIPPQRKRSSLRPRFAIPPQRKRAPASAGEARRGSASARTRLHTTDPCARGEPVNAAVCKTAIGGGGTHRALQDSPACGERVAAAAATSRIRRCRSAARTSAP